jgi:transposase
MNGNALNTMSQNGPPLELQPGSVVICDNLASHCTRAAASALRDVGCWLFYLPPCARALNSVRMACPNPKARLCRIEPRPFDQGYDALTEICNRFSPDDCWNVFCEAGYGSNEKRGALGDIPPNNSVFATMLAVV